MKRCIVHKKNGILPDLSRGWDFLSYCMKSSPLICAGDMLMHALAIGILPVLGARIWGISVDNIISGKPVAGWLILLAVIGGSTTAYMFWGEILDNLFRCNISLLMQERIHQKAKKLSAQKYEESQIRDLADKANTVFYFGPAIGFFFSTELIGVSLICAVSSMVCLYSYHPWFLGILMALTGIDFCKVLIEKKRSRIATAQTEEKRLAQNDLSYLHRFGFVKETKMHLAGDYFACRWKQRMLRVLEKENRQYGNLAFWNMVVSVLGMAFLVTGYGLGIYYLFSGRISVGAFGSVMILLRQTEKYTETFTQALSSLGGDLVHIKEGYRFLELEEDHPAGKRTSEHIIREELRGVSFRYPETDAMAVSHIDLALTSGKTYAIVGENGAGKTTLARILLGLFSPDQGTIYVNDQNLEEIEEGERYGSVSTVFQDFCSYPLTVEESISLKENPDARRIKELLPPFVEEGEVLGKEIGGRELSGGEKQQLAVARGRYKCCDVLVLDEPNSALDPLAEQKVYESFALACENKIGVIITHRLGITKLADEIIVMKNGEIIGKGVHNVLLAQCPYYKELWDAGSSMYGINET